MTAIIQPDTDVKDGAAADAAFASFEAAWKSIATDKLPSMNTIDLRVRLARAILDRMKVGERDPERLRMAAVQAVRQGAHAGSVQRTDYYL